MTPAFIDRRRLKAETKTLLADAQVSHKAMVALYLGLLLVLDVLIYVTGDSGLLYTFVTILSTLINMVLSSGLVLYCMAVRRGERAEFFTLFDGFSMAGKVILVSLLRSVLIALWSMLFFIPGIVASYRYRFALYNLYENPQLSAFKALRMSKQQTQGYKMQLFTLDMSYVGWFLLAALPLMVEMFWYNSEVMMHSVMQTPVPETLAVYAFLPRLGWLLLTGLWQLVVSIFFMAQMQCVDLGYFETAKTTSGVGAAQTDPFTPDDF